MKDIDHLVDNLNHPSQHLTEVLKAPPGWLLKWGQTLLLMLMLSLVALTHFYRYPDRVLAEVLITTPDPVLPIVSRTEGRISHLFVKENQSVQKNDPLAVIHGPASYQDVMKLQSLIQDSVILDDVLLNRQSYQWLDQQLILGSIQSDYVVFQKNANKYLTFLELKPNYRHQQSIWAQINRYKELLSLKQEQILTIERKVKLSHKDYERHRQLLNTGAISEKEFEDREQAYLEVRQELEDSRAEKSRIDVEIVSLQKEVDLLGVGDAETISELKVRLSGSLEELKAAIDQWQEKHILTASQDGRVVFSDFWTAQSFIREEEEVFSILPEAQDSIVGQMRVPVENSGKLKLGQSVDIYLSNYPELEFGAIQGRVIQISQIPKKDRYNVVVFLGKGLTTDYGIPIPFQQNMQGYAEIITQEMSLLDRIFDSLLRTKGKFGSIK